MNKFLAFMTAFLIAGCSSSHKGHQTGNLYLTDVIVNEDNSVVATVVLPENHYGFLLLNDSLVALNVVVASGDVELGVFEPGEYTLCLELFLSPTGADILDAWAAGRHRTGRNGPPFQDLTGVRECVDFVVPVLEDPVPPDDPPPPDNPPPDDPPPFRNPKLLVRVNNDGAICVIIKLRDAEDTVLYDVIADEETLITEDNTHLVLDRACGDYAFELHQTDTGDLITRKEIVLACPPDEPDPDPDDPRIPPRPDDPRTRYVICHKGITKIVPWAALKAHLLVHGDTLGPCDD
jgi:hypothetical protein